MAYLRSFWACANNAKNKINNQSIYKYTNDVEELKLDTGASPWGIVVSADKMSIYVTNQNDGTVGYYRNGEHLADIPVQGVSPYGICESPVKDKDGNYPIFVTNYSSHTITKIVNGSVVEVIPSTGMGPRGICASPEGHIYVANYLTNDVSVIWKGLTLYEKTIEVATGPDGICSDSKGNIYVACAVSSVVSKINNNIKVADVNVGNYPRGIAIDTHDNVWCCNYFDRSVSKINGADLTQETFPVGNGPLSIAVALSDHGQSEILVFCYEDKTILRLDGQSGAQINTIMTGYNPVAFGDATGMQSYLMNKTHSSLNPGGVEKVSWDDLDKNLQDIINGMTHPELYLKAANVILANHPEFATVQAALDHLLYVKPTVNSFVIASPKDGIAETGSSVSDIIFNWTVENGDSIESQAITSANLHANPGSIAPGLTTLEATNMNVYVDDNGISHNGLTTNTTFKLTIKDKAKETITKEVTLKFLPKIYYGVSKTTIMSDTEILHLTNNDFIDVIADQPMNKSMVFDATGGHYLVFAIPSAYRLNAGGGIKIGGLINSDWEVKQNFEITNASGYTNRYDVFTSRNIQTDENLVVDISFGTGNSNSTDPGNSAGGGFVGP